MSVSKVPLLSSSARFKIFETYSKVLGPGTPKQPRKGKGFQSPDAVCEFGPITSDQLTLRRSEISTKEVNLCELENRNPR